MGWRSWARARAAGALVAGVALLMAWPSGALAGAGALDRSFGGDGRVVTPGIGELFDVSIDADGRIVAAGNAAGRFAVARYRRDGSLDSTFAGDGIATTRMGAGASALGLALAPGGRIVVAGRILDGTSTRFALARYREDGTLDPTFGGDGRVLVPRTDGEHGGATDVAVQPDGRAVAVGTVGTQLFVVRYRRDGSLDATFGQGGIVTTRIDAWPDATVELQADGRIVVGGTGRWSVGGATRSSFIVVRYLADGTIDDTFGIDGMAKVNLTWHDLLTDLAIAPDGRIVLAGKAGFRYESSGSFGVVRLRRNGTLDPTFSGDGKVVTKLSGSNGQEPDDWAQGVAVRTGGGVVAAGFAGAPWNGGATIGVTSYTRTGALDRAFSEDGKLRTSFALPPAAVPPAPWDFHTGTYGYAVAIDDDGAVVVVGGQYWMTADGGGGSRAVLARYQGP